MSRVIPSVMACGQKELDALFLRLKGVSTRLHLDVLDGAFAPTRSLWFAFRLHSGFKYSAHVMTSHPARWVLDHGAKFEVCFSQVETVEDIPAYIAVMKQKKWKVGFALCPETPAAALKKYITQIDAVLVLTVKPGYYGSPFLPRMLSKVRLLKKWNPALRVYVDGHMNSETISGAVIAGGDYFIVGSAVSLAIIPLSSRRELDLIVRRTARRRK